MGTPTTIYVTKEFEDSSGVIPLQAIGITIIKSVNQVVVGAVAGKKIRLTSIVVTADAECFCTINSGTGYGLQTLPLYVPAKQNVILSHQSVGWFETAVGANVEVVYTSASNYLYFWARYLVITP